MVTDKTRREAFITQNLGLVHACAGRFRVGAAWSMTIYTAQGAWDSIKAYDNFDESRGVCFSTYAVPGDPWRDQKSCFGMEVRSR
ncbi:MAG: hypothetical protein ACLT9S_11165 [Faecalibacterium sp.]